MLLSRTRAGSQAEHHGVEMRRRRATTTTPVTLITYVRADFLSMTIEGAGDEQDGFQGCVWVHFPLLYFCRRVT